MKKNLLLVLMLLFVNVVSTYGQVRKWPDEIRLKDGTLVIGEIVEHKPDKGYLILLPTGETKFYKNEDIESVRDRENTQEGNGPIVINNSNNNSNYNNNVNNNIVVEHQTYIDTVVVLVKPKPDLRGYLALVGGGGSSLSPLKKGFGMFGLDFSYLVTPYIGAGLHIASTTQTPYSIGTYMAGPMLSFEVIRGIRVETKTMLGMGNINLVKTDSIEEKHSIVEEYLKTGIKFSYAVNAQVRLNLGRSWCFLFGYDLTGAGKFIKSEFYAGLGLRMFR
ncbi:MAG: hypothetical protein ACFNUH_08105 [Bacteroidota bacterium]|jgi:hypothetical protein